MTKFRFSPAVFSGLLVALFFALALFLRVFPPYDKIFVGDWIKFASADAYYHMRYVDNLVHNFPHHMQFDPYFIYPGAPGEVVIRFFIWVLAATSWMIGLGSPTQHTVDVVGVFFPAVLGALNVIPVYFIGKVLFGRWAGLLSAALLAILPGEFMGRSILGFTDYDIANVLFTSLTMLFLILAIKTGSQNQLTFNHLKNRDWAVLRKPVIYSMLAATFLGIYIFTWLGALLFVFITFVYFVIQFIIDHLKHKSTDYLCLVGLMFFSITLLISLLVSVSTLYLNSLLIALLMPLVLGGLSWLMASKKIKPVYYPLALLGLGLAGVGIFYLVSPNLLRSMLEAFRIFHPTGAQLTTIEMQPFISSSYGNPFAIAWGNFTTGFFLSFLSLLILIYLVIKEGSGDKTLLIVWSLIILAATLGQRRFAIYFAVNVALLTGYFSWRILEWAGLKTTEEVQSARAAVGERVRRKKEELRITASRAAVIVFALIIIFFGVFFWNIEPAIVTASAVRFAPSDAWVSSLRWLKENTPEPLGDPDAYYALLSSSGGGFQYPESAYGVLAWWDYGYWISRIAHRLPNANPSQGPGAVTDVASFFLSKDEKSASEIVQKLGSAYVIVDYETALSKFWAIVTWGGEDPRDYFDDVYLLPQENQTLKAVILVHPEYYRSLAVRLYNFDGRAVTPESTRVISYEERPDKSGRVFKIITSDRTFNSYEEAVGYISEQESPDFEIVSDNPMVSPVPLEALEHYKLIYSSDEPVMLPGVGAMPALKIFEYIE
ncbi:MAG: oligosaccharyl transferase, archaeosortase A system-associated [Dehalococcoidales bacterium]|nr:oligosaccharyl transferase, archaeosortase A system-associated [Dehalococcoidales bacterium]